MLEEDDSGDSLELLLDTLCCVFGCIILITLLIALMSQEAHDAEAAPKNHRTQALIEEQEILRLEDEIVIEQALAPTTLTPIPDDLSELARKNRTLAQSRDESKSEITRLRERLDDTPVDGSDLAEELSRRENELENRTSRTEAVNRQLESELAEIRSSFLESQNELSSSRRERTKRLRLPKEKTNSSKKFLWVVVNHGKIYPIAFKAPWNSRFNEHFSITGNTTNIFYEPKIHMGFNPSRDQDRVALGNYFRTLSRGSEYLAFEVFTDDACFKAFNEAKELATGMSIGYTWEPTEKPGLGLTTSGGTAARPEQ